MKFAQNGWSPGYHDNARGIPIEPVYQFQVSVVGAQLPQALYQAKAEATAAMHRQSRGFIDNQQPLVFVDHPLCYLLCPVARYRRRRGGRRPVQGGYTHQISSGQAIIRLNPALVDPDFSLAHGSVQAGLGHSL